jgi:hypothetical protein
MSYIFSVPQRCKKIGWEGVNLIHLAQDKDEQHIVVNRVINLLFMKREKFDQLKNQ